MKSVPIPPPTDKYERILENYRDSMTIINVVIDSLINNNQKLNLNDVMNYFKSKSYFTLDDLEKYKPVIIDLLTKTTTKQR